MLSDSEEENPFILEEPAITSTFSAARRQQHKMNGQRDGKGPRASKPCSSLPPRAQLGALNAENVILLLLWLPGPGKKDTGAFFKSLNSN